MHRFKTRLALHPRVQNALRHSFMTCAFALLAATSCNPASAAAVSASSNQIQGGGLDFHVTLGTDASDGACGSDTQLDVTQLDPVNFCYTVTNQSDSTLTYQTLADDVSGTLLSAIPLTLAPGATYQYNRVIIARASQAPTSTWTGYDAHPGYDDADNSSPSDALFADGFEGGSTPTTNYDFLDITAIGTTLDLNDDDTINVGLGFPFTFYGQTSDQIVVSNNGGILFGVTGGFLTPQNAPLPDADLGAAILPYWTDIYYQQPEDGNTYVATLGVAPHRRFVVEWFNLPIMIGGIDQDSATFEAVFFEGSNQILFQYADTDVGDPQRNDGITTTIGLNAPAGVEASLQYSYKQASVSAGKAILFSPTHPQTYSASQAVTLDVGVPQITVAPGQFNVSADAGGSTSGTLTIGNIGNRPLTWNIDSVASDAHFPQVPRLTHPMGDPALTSAAPAPHVRAPKSSMRKPAPSADGIPAFGIDLDSSSFVSLDPTQPATLTPIGDGIGDLILTAGAFVDEDFSKLYVIDYYTTNLLTIDTASGAITLVGTAALSGDAGISWSSLAWDSSTATLYGLAYTQTRDGFFSYLYKIDPVTATPTLVGPISGIGVPGPGDGTGALVISIAIDSSGLMYGVELLDDDFVAIDKTSGNAAVINTLTFDANFAQAMDFDDYTGTLYYAAFNASIGEAEMYTVDPQTGELTFIGPIGADPSNTQLTAFAIARLGGVCAYPNQVPWLSFGSTRGATAAGDSTDVGVTFNASALSAGTYSADICVASNDLTNRRVAVPVSFTVN